jgi:hypothetical protein
LPVVTSQQILYADSQTQNEAHIPAQAPIPAGIHAIEISWDRRAGWMRAVIGSQTWHFKELLGKAQMTGTDSIRGRINVRAMARLEDETLMLYRAPDAVPHARVEGVERMDTHNRLCYRRSHRDWRVRDERRPEAADALVFVTGYVGDLNVEWEGRDPIAHIFHNGEVVVDADRLAHLYDNG